MKGLILGLALVMAAPAAYAMPESEVNRIAEAIYIIEGKDLTRFPYGIVSIDTGGDRLKARRICRNTVRNQFRRHGSHNCGKDFLTCLRDRYCPLGAENDLGNLNRHWLKNLKQVLNKNETKK